MRVYKLLIPFKPEPKRSVRRGAYGYYNPSATGMAKIKAYVKSQYLEAPLTGPLLTIVHFKLPAAKRTSPKHRAAWEGRPHSRYPDGDNLEKHLNDALNGVLWRDDGQIAWTLRSKTYTSDAEGSISLYVAEISPSATHYPSIASHLIAEIETQEPRDARP